MTIEQILKNYYNKLNSNSPILDIELLLTKTLNQRKEYLFTYPDKKLTQNQLTKFKQLFNRRKKGEPIAYILGYQEFFNLKFKVNKNVLIPRPETEIIVEEVMQFTKRHKPFAICDIGVGSGAIIIALAYHFCHTACPPKLRQRQKPVECIDKNAQIKFYGTDISNKALQIAKQNAKIHEVFCHTEPNRSINKKPCINFLKGDLLKPVKNKKIDIITANLPYLDTKEKNLLPSSDTRGLKFEPRTAWDGGADGLKYYRDFFEQIKKFNLKPQAIFLEIGHTQASQIKNLTKQTLPQYKFKVKKDLCGFDRVVIITK